MMMVPIEPLLFQVSEEKEAFKILIRAFLA